MNENETSATTTMTAAARSWHGRRVRVVYNYKATMNDELNLTVGDICVISQCSEDETWLEGSHLTQPTLTGWFPSNYVRLIEHNPSNNPNNKETSVSCKSSPLASANKQAIIACLNELRQGEERFLDDMCKFVKLAILPLQQQPTSTATTNNATVFSIKFTHQMHVLVDDLIRCHQSFFHQLKEIHIGGNGSGDLCQSQIGNLLVSMAPMFHQCYEPYAQSAPILVNAIRNKRDAIDKHLNTKVYVSTISQQQQMKSFDLKQS